MTDLVIETWSYDFKRTGVLGRFSTFEAIPRFRDVGAWSVSVPAGSAQATPLVAHGARMVAFYEDTPTDPIISGPVRQRKLVVNEQFPDGLWQFAGPDDNAWLSAEPAYPVPAGILTGTLLDQSAQAHDVRTGAAETVVKGYVNENIGPGAASRRRVVGLTVEADLARGSTVTGRARMQQLGDLVRSMAVAGGIGYRVVQLNRALVFQVYVPVDRSAKAKFSFGMGNLRELEWTNTDPEVTSAVVGGGGALTARVFREVTDPTAEAAARFRASTFLDRRDTSAQAEMEQTAVEEMLERGLSTALSIRTLDVPALRYSRDYRMGDTVTVVPPVGSLAPVVDVLGENSISWSPEEGWQSGTSVGTRTRTGTRWAQQRIKVLDRAVRALQART